MTSQLLINEPPLQVLPSLAKLIGLNEAIILQQMHYWIGRSKNNYDGRLWVYKTYAEWGEEFPFWSTDTIARAINKLEGIGLILSTDQYNTIKTDRTKWYAIDYDKLDELFRAPQLAVIEHRNLRSSRAPQIAVILPETTQETTTADRPAVFHLMETIWGQMVSGAYEADQWRELEQDYSLVWIEDAMKEAVKNGGGTRRSIRYVQSVLKRWKDEGRTTPKTDTSDDPLLDAWLPG